MSGPSVDEVWTWLRAVPDPEIPTVSVVDLGIVRDVRWDDGDAGELVVTVTPTYSGCPATAVIALSIEDELHRRGLARVRLERRLSPAWTTDWISPEGRQRLAQCGIAPPPAGVPPLDPLARFAAPAAAVPCPRCGGQDTVCVSRFGSTPCKAQYRCRGCLEPFDHFKCF